MSFTITLQQTGKQFVVAQDETILDGARRAGLALPYSCLGGRCGSCKATVIEGECDYPNQPPLGLSEDEREHHEALLCQAVPLSDCVIVAREVASVADMPKRQFAVKVSAKDRLAPDVMRLKLKTPRGQKMHRLAGQYLDVLIADGKRRAFSIANAPEGEDEIELHIRHVSGGGFTAHVFEQLELGALLRIEGPLGTFVPREDSERAMIFVAGGTGFAPIKALIEHFIALGSMRPMHLYWGARAQQDLYLPDLPAQWADQHPAFFYTSVLSDPLSQFEQEHHRIGLVHDIVLQDFPSLQDFDVYMSGPPPMIEAARRAFSLANLQADRLFYDSFEYAPEVLAAILKNRAGIQA